MIASAVRPGRAGRAVPGAGRLAGVGELTRLALRRDRVMLPAWAYVLAGSLAEVAFSLRGLYPTAARRDALVASVAGNPALSFLYGHVHGTSLGALDAWRYLAYSTLGAGLMSIFLVIRHTRADEQAGRLELVGSAAVGRRAALTSALAVAATANAVVLALIVAVSVLLRLPAAGAVAYGLATAGCGLVFAALAAVAAQVSGTPRGARGLALAVLAVGFVLRGVGDSAGARGPEWLSWLSPAGWAEQARPFAGDRWAVLALPALATALLTGLAYVLAAHRDLGAGLFATRPGPATAGAALSGPAGLAWRLQRANLGGWALGLLAMGVAVGAAAKGVGALLGTSPQVRQAFERIGGQQALTSAYLAAVMSLAGLAAAGYAVSAALRLRGEESARLAEVVLVTPTGRLRWAVSHLAVVVVGTAVVLAAAGLGAGLGYGLRAGDAGTQVPRLLAAALVQLPAALVVAGAAVALFGLRPAWSVTGGWVALGLATLAALLGPTLRLPQWLADIFPFGHVPRLPGSAVSATPLIWLSAVALVLAAAGLAGLRHRDLG
ncbi:MAG TPA: ABC transporter permease [Streptosporangiaceae bacterium]